MKIYSCEVILDGLLNALNNQLSTGVSYTHKSDPLWGVSLQCARSSHAVPTQCTQPKNIAKHCTNTVGHRVQ